MEKIIENWQWILLGFYVIEKIVKATPTNKDDVIFDMILKPIFEAFKTIIGKSSNKKRKDLVDKI